MVDRKLQPMLTRLNSHLSDTGDDADTAELLQEIRLRYGVGKARDIDPVVIALLSAVLSTIESTTEKEDDKQSKGAAGGRSTRRRKTSGGQHSRSM